jgi:hypothetical protein
MLFNGYFLVVANELDDQSRCETRFWAKKGRDVEMSQLSDDENKSLTMMSFRCPLFVFAGSIDALLRPNYRFPFSYAAQNLWQSMIGTGDGGLLFNRRSRGRRD